MNENENRRLVSISMSNDESISKRTISMENECWTHSQQSERKQQQSQPMSEIECRKTLLESSSMGSSSKSKNKSTINNHSQRQQQRQQQSSVDGNKAEDNLRVGREEDDDDDDDERKWECSKATAAAVIELISTSTTNHHIDELSASNKRPDADAESSTSRKYQKQRCKASKSSDLDNNTTTRKAINLYDNCKSGSGEHEHVAIVADDDNCQTISDTPLQHQAEEQRSCAASATFNLTGSSSAVTVERHDESDNDGSQQFPEASTSAALVKVKTWETATVCKPATPKKEF